MKWKSEEDKKASYASIIDQWDQDIFDFAEHLGLWLELGNDYKDFNWSPAIHPDQLGLALGLMVSEWDGDLWSLLSPVERAIAAFYVGEQIKVQSELAASQGHKGEADETLKDVDLDI